MTALGAVSVRCSATSTGSNVPTLVIRRGPPQAARSGQNGRSRPARRARVAAGVHGPCRTCSASRTRFENANARNHDPHNAYKLLVVRVTASNGFMACVTASCAGTVSGFVTHRKKKAAKAAQPSSLQCVVPNLEGEVAVALIRGRNRQLIGMAALLDSIGVLDVQ